MKRKHQRLHIIVWLLLAPVLIIILALAIFARPDTVVNPAFSPDLIVEASDVS